MPRPAGACRRLVVAFVAAAVALPVAAWGQEDEEPPPLVPTSPQQPATPAPVTTPAPEPSQDWESPAPDPTPVPARPQHGVRSTPRPASNRQTGSAPRTGDVRLAPVIRSVETDARRIALTLDDGWNADDAILDLVATWGVRGTAFLVGSVARSEPELVRRLVELGWEVCSHTDTHRVLPPLPDAAIEREIARGVEAVRQASGQSCPYFRAPGGFVNWRVQRVAQRLGLKVIGWDSSISDATSPGTDPRVQVDIAMRTVRPGSILLGHFGGVNTYEVLNRVLGGLIAAGYEIGNVTELLNLRDADTLTSPAVSPQEEMGRRLSAAEQTAVRAEAPLPVLVVDPTPTSTADMVGMGALLVGIIFALGVLATHTRRPRPRPRPKTPRARVATAPARR